MRVLMPNHFPLQGSGRMEILFDFHSPLIPQVILSLNPVFIAGDHRSQLVDVPSAHRGSSSVLRRRLRSARRAHGAFPADGDASVRACRRDQPGPGGPDAGGHHRLMGPGAFR